MTPRPPAPDPATDLATDPALDPGAAPDVTEHVTEHAPGTRPSKSQVKRDMHALLALGKELVALSPERLAQLPLDDALLAAIRLAQRTTSREGRRRQIHYVGKLMRAAPAQAIRAQLHAWQHGSHAQTAHMHRLESQRDALLADDAALSPLLERLRAAQADAQAAALDAMDAQSLRAQVRAARKEAAANAALKPGQAPQRKHYRALFQTLKLLDEA